MEIPWLVANLEYMKTITLQTAVMLSIREFIESSKSFSSYDITKDLRKKVDLDYAISDIHDVEVNDDGSDGPHTIYHEQVQPLVAQLSVNGFIAATKSYESSGTGSTYILYTPIADISKELTSAVSTPQPPPVVTVERIKAYLQSKGQATAKQIQSAIKVRGLRCEDILRDLNVNYSGIKPSKVIVFKN